MRKIAVPPEAVFVMGAPGSPETRYSFVRFVCDAVDGFPMFGKGFRNIERGRRIVEAVAEGKVEVFLQDDDYDALKDAIEGTGWAPRAARACIPFFDAVNKAEQTKP